MVWRGDALRKLTSLSQTVLHSAQATAARRGREREKKREREGESGRAGESEWVFELMALTGGIQNAGEICRYESSESSTGFVFLARFSRFPALRFHERKRLENMKGRRSGERARFILLSWAN